MSKNMPENLLQQRVIEREEALETAEQSASDLLQKEEEISLEEKKSLF